MTQTTPTSSAPSTGKASSSSIAHAKPRSSGIGTGEVVGIAIGTFAIGVLLAGLLLMMWQRRSKGRRSRKDGGFRDHGIQESMNEKRGLRPGAVVEVNDFDHDRLFPQPLDDSAVRGQTQNLFSPIDAHVESFYTDVMDEHINSGLPNDTPQALLDLRTRLFMIKKIITSVMLESISDRCEPDRAFLPLEFTDVARRLQEKNLNDHGGYSRRRKTLTNTAQQTR